MTLLPPDDEQNLVNFLKQYRPSPPPARANLEACLMQQVKQMPTRSRYQNCLGWMIPTAIAACSLIAWGSYRWLNPVVPSMTFSEENTVPITTNRVNSDIFARQTIVSSEELETFLLESWTGTMDYTIEDANSTTLELSWYSLVDSDTNNY